MDFYAQFAADYDAVVDADARAAAIGAFVDRLAGEGKVQSAIDVACGNGAYALALAARGARVVGVDLSEAMIEQARRRAAAEGAAVEWRVAPMQEIASHAAGPFDAVLCMGNSLPHVLTDDQLAQTLAGFSQIVSDDGVVIVHLLNYARVLARQERVVGVTRHGDTEYVRFYDFLAESVRFNVLEIRWSDGQPDHRLTSTLLRPYPAEQLVTALAAAGLGRVDLFGDLQFNAFDRDRSDVLVVVARKG